MNTGFWENPGEFSVQPHSSGNTPNGQQGPYLTLFARVDVSFNGFAEELLGFDGVAVAPFESYHLTVKQIGEVRADEISSIVSAINRLVQYTEPIEIVLEGVDVFPNCVYVPGYSDELELFHSMLCDLDMLEPIGFEGDDYMPHVTVGKFVSEDIDMIELHELLSKYQDEGWVTLTINSIHLVKDKPVDGESVFLPFESVAEFEFGGFES